MFGGNGMKTVQFHSVILHFGIHAVVCHLFLSSLKEYWCFETRCNNRVAVLPDPPFKMAFLVNQQFFHWVVCTSQPLLPHHLQRCTTNSPEITRRSRCSLQNAVGSVLLKVLNTDQ